MPEQQSSTSGGTASAHFSGGLAELATALAAGETTSLGAVTETLDHIAATQPTLNAFRVVRAEQALAEAAEADLRLAAGERAPLLGVPIAIKDDMDLAGETTPFGCRGEFEPRAEDGELARRLRAAGAVIVGKTNTPEVGQWSVTAGPAFGVTRNPWNLEHTPGGSSGGSAAAVAAGILPAAVGSDGAGSIRIPASWTNLVGIKTQRGRVSPWPDAEPFNGIAVIGPIARTVGDAALLLDAIAGNHPADIHRVEPPSEPFATFAEREPRRLRVALSFRIPFSAVPTRLDARVRTQVERLAGVLAGLGHDVVPAEPAAYRLIGLTFVPRSMAGIREWVKQNGADPKLLDKRTRHNAGMGALFGGPVLKLARKAEPLLHRSVGRIFDDFDVVLAPTTAAPPLAADAINGLSSTATDRVIVGACPYAWPWNVLGWPAVNVPAGFTPEGLPVGAQLMGPEASEPLLISLAAELERAERWFERRPAEIVPAAG